MTLQILRLHHNEPLKIVIGSVSTYWSSLQSPSPTTHWIYFSWNHSCPWSQAESSLLYLFLTKILSNNQHLILLLFETLYSSAPWHLTCFPPYLKRSSLTVFVFFWTSKYGNILGSFPFTLFICLTVYCVCLSVYLFLVLTYPSWSWIMQTLPTLLSM